MPNYTVYSDYSMNTVTVRNNLIVKKSNINSCPSNQTFVRTANPNCNIVIGLNGSIRAISQ